MDKTPSLPDVNPCSGLKRSAGRIIAAALLLAVSAAPAATADLSFTGRVINPRVAAFVPARALVRIAGNRAILDVAVSSPDGFYAAPSFTAVTADGEARPVIVLQGTLRGPVLMARVQVATGGSKRELIDVCLELPAARQVCGRYIINHLH